MRRLLGWEPAEVTTYEYDDAGRLSRSITTRESEFSAWDRALMLESRREDAEPRSSTGWLLSEATNPENEYKFVVDLPTTDFAARALHQAQERYRKQCPDATPHDLLWRVSKVD